MMKHYLFLVFFSAVTTLFLLSGCTENIPGLPYTTSQLINQSTDLNYASFVAGDYNTFILQIDGNKITASDCITLHDGNTVCGLNDMNVAYVKGDKGDTGADGNVGPQGPQGIDGNVGPIGPVGPAGADGNNAFSVICAVGELYYLDSNGDYACRASGLDGNFLDESLVTINRTSAVTGLTGAHSVVESGGGFYVGTLQNPGRIGYWDDPDNNLTPTIYTLGVGEYQVADMDANNGKIFGLLGSGEVIVFNEGDVAGYSVLYDFNSVVGGYGALAAYSDFVYVGRDTNIYKIDITDGSIDAEITTTCSGIHAGVYYSSDYFFMTSGAGCIMKVSANDLSYSVINSVMNITDDIAIYDGYLWFQSENDLLTVPSTFKVGRVDAETFTGIEYLPNTGGFGVFPRAASSGVYATGLGDSTGLGSIWFYEDDVYPHGDNPVISVAGYDSETNFVSPNEMLFTATKNYFFTYGNNPLRIVDFSMPVAKNVYFTDELYTSRGINGVYVGQDENSNAVLKAEVLFGGTQKSFSFDITGSDKISNYAKGVDVNSWIDSKADTNCGVAGSCPDVAYMNYSNTGDMNVSGVLRSDSNLLCVSGVCYNIPDLNIQGGGVPTTRQLGINGTVYDLSEDRNWTVAGGSGTDTNEFTALNVNSSNQRITNLDFNKTTPQISAILGQGAGIGQGFNHNGSNYLATSGGDPLAGLPKFTIMFWGSFAEQTSKGFVGTWNNDADMSALIFTGVADVALCRVDTTTAAAKTVTGTTDVQTNNTWYFFVCTYDGANIRLYINGSQEGGDVAQTGVVSTSTYPFEIGRYDASGTTIPTGVIDEVVVLDKVLSGAEITTQYNAGVGTYYTPDVNTKALYHAEGDSNDTTGNYNLTWSGGASYATGKVPSPASMQRSVGVEGVNGVLANEKGIWKYGDVAGGSVEQFGSQYWWKVGGTTSVGKIDNNYHWCIGVGCVDANSNMYPLTVRGATNGVAVYAPDGNLAGKGLTLLSTIDTSPEPLAQLLALNPSRDVTGRIDHVASYGKCATSINDEIIVGYTDENEPIMVKIVVPAYDAECELQLAINALRETGARLNICEAKQTKVEDCARNSVDYRTFQRCITLTN